MKNGFSTSGALRDVVVTALGITRQKRSVGYSVSEVKGATLTEARDNSFVNSLEGLVAIQFKEFRYSTPKISIDTKFAFYPGLSDWGRIRLDFQLTSKIEIFKDFNVGLTFYEVYDNEPASQALSKSDFGINFTVGYEFNK